MVRLPVLHVGAGSHKAPLSRDERAWLHASFREKGLPVATTWRCVGEVYLVRTVKGVFASVGSVGSAMQIVVLNFAAITCRDFFNVNASRPSAT